MRIVDNRITLKIVGITSHLSFVKRFLIFFSVCFLTLSAIFCSASFLSTTTSESSASYISNCIKHSEINYLPLIAEQQDKEHEVPNTYYEFHALYGAFKESNITYVGSVNGDKQKTINISAFDSFQNLSFIYAEYFTNPEYNGHYKHQYYPLELMFHGVHTTNGTKAFSFCYISQTQADELITKNYFGDSTIDSYSQLIGKIIYLNFDGIEYPYMIGNIYLESNYFFQGLKRCFW